MSIAGALIFTFVAAADSLLAGPVETVAEGFQFTEGPIWTTNGELIFSDIPADKVYKLDKSVVFEPSGKSNGLTIDDQGRIIRCEHANRRVVRIEKNGEVTVLASEYQGKKLNSPNDAVFHRTSGTVFFTDPTYGLEGRDSEQRAQGVYAIHKDGKIVRVADDFIQPNGIALSPDDKHLYVADTEGKHIRVSQVNKDGRTGSGFVLCSVPKPDGIRVDTEDRIWATCDDGIIVFDGKSGKKIETIPFPQIPANCGFGGPDGKTLYVTARTAVYSVKTHTTGLIGGWKR